MLTSFRIKCLVDVRTFPGSRRYPHFNKEFLSSSLEMVPIKYIHLPELGGRRKPVENSINTNFRNASFKGYADHMLTPSFSHGIKMLLDYATHVPTAFMCSEAVWWRCHRSLISDHLKSNGWSVIHIMAENKGQAHKYSSAATSTQGKLFYG